MAQTCLPAGCVRLMRVWHIDECTGDPVVGANEGYVLDCIRNVLWTPNIEEGDTVTLQTDCKKICWQTTECDDLINYNIEVELLNPDYEFEELVTGNSLINDGVNNIGIKHLKDTDCHPWVGLELFEEIPKDACEGGFEVRRLVFPRVRFMPPEVEKEETFRLVKYTIKTAPGFTATYGDGPFNDSAIDFSTADPDEKVHLLEYYDTAIDLDVTTGQCGYLAVPAQP